MRKKKKERKGRKSWDCSSGVRVWKLWKRNECGYVCILPPASQADVIGNADTDITLENPALLKTKLKPFPWFSQVPSSKFEANLSRGS